MLTHNECEPVNPSRRITTVGMATHHSAKKILELIKENPYIQRKELVSRLGIHESSVKRRLVSLQEKGIIRHVGPNKGGYWEVQKGF